MKPQKENLNLLIKLDNLSLLGCPLSLSLSLSLRRRKHPLHPLSVVISPWPPPKLHSPPLLQKKTTLTWNSPLPLLPTHSAILLDPHRHRYRRREISSSKSKRYHFPAKQSRQLHQPTISSTKVNYFHSTSLPVYKWFKTSSIAPTPITHQEKTNLSQKIFRFLSSPLKLHLTSPAISHPLSHPERVASWTQMSICWDLEEKLRILLETHQENHGRTKLSNWNNPHRLISRHCLGNLLVLLNPCSMKKQSAVSRTG